MLFEQHQKATSEAWEQTCQWLHIYPISTCPSDLLFPQNFSTFVLASSPSLFWFLCPIFCHASDLSDDLVLEFYHHLVLILMRMNYVVFPSLYLYPFYVSHGDRQKKHDGQIYAYLYLMIHAGDVMIYGGMVFCHLQRKTKSDSGSLNENAFFPQTCLVFYLNDDVCYFEGMKIIQVEVIFPIQFVIITVKNLS